MPVESLAREDVVTARPEASVEDLARVVFERTVGSVVVVVDDERVVGVVADRDLTIELFAEDGDASLIDPDVSVDEITAADVMTTDPLTVTTDDELPGVFHHMSDAHARRIPVVDEDGRIAGILSLDDVVIHLAGESTHVPAQFDNVAEVIRSESPES